MVAPAWITLEHLIWLASRLGTRQTPVDLGRFQLILFHLAWTQAMTHCRTFGCRRWVIQDQVPHALGLIMVLKESGYFQLGDVEAACNRRPTTLRVLVGNRFILEDPGLGDDLDPRLNFIIGQPTQHLLAMARNSDPALLTRHGDTVDILTFACRRSGRARTLPGLAASLC